MSAGKKILPISIDDYLQGELESPVRHEYVGGYVYAMAGARVAHNLISSNIIVNTGGQLRGKPCRPFGSDMKIQIPGPPHDRFYYPDASIICSSNPQNALYQSAPTIIFEVISKSTRRIDMGEKKDAYLSLSSLAAYVMVEQNFAHVSVFRRTQHSFVCEQYEGLQAVISFPEIDLRLALADVYEDIDFASEIEEE